VFEPVFFVEETGVIEEHPSDKVDETETVTFIQPIDDDERIAELTGYTENFYEEDFLDSDVSVAEEALAVNDVPFSFAVQFNTPVVEELKTEPEQDPDQVIIEDEEGLFSIGNITSIGNNEFNADFQKLVNSVLKK
jgi:hypothetical protein